MDHSFAFFANEWEKWKHRAPVQASPVRLPHRLTLGASAETGQALGGDIPGVPLAIKQRLRQMLGEVESLESPHIRKKTRMCGHAAV